MAVAIGGITAAGKFTKIISSLKLILNPLTLVAVAFGVLFKALKTDSENGGTALTDLKNVAVTVFDSIKGAISIFVDIISNNKATFTNIINGITELLPPLVEALGELLTAGLELATVALPVLLDIFKELFNAIKPFLKQLPKFIGFFADIIKACAKADVIETLVKIFIAYKAAMAAVNAVEKIHNGLLVLQAAKTKIATAATKLFNLSMKAGPIMLVVSAVGLLAGGLTAYSAIAKNGSKDSEQLTRHIQDVVGNIHSMRDAFDNAKVMLPDYSKIVSDNGYFMDDIDDMIAEKEAAITEAIKLGIKDQKKARDEDIRNIKQYNQDIQGLEEDKLSIYLGEQFSQIDKMKNMLKNEDFDQQGVADLLKSAGEALNQSNDAIEDIYTRRLTINRNTEKLTGEAQEAANNEAYQWYKDQKKMANDSYNDIYNIAVSKSRQLVSQTGIDFNDLINKLGQIKYFSDSATGGVHDTFFHAKEAGREFVKDTSINVNAAKTEVEATLNSIDNESAQAINNLFLFANEAKNQGIDLSNDTKSQINDILSFFQLLPPELQEQGTMLLAGLMQGMTDKNGELIDTTDMSCQEVINAARNAFDIHSPSRVFSEMGIYIGEGLSQGIEESMPKVTQIMNTCIKNIMHSAESFDFDSIGQGAELISGNVILSFTRMSKSTGKIFCGMNKTVVSIITGMTSIVILNLKTMSLQVATILSSMSVNTIITMNQMKSNISNIDLYSSGVNIMNGLINGMKSRLSAISMAASTVASTVKNTINHALDINSPSRVLYKIGEYTGQGQINGMKSTLPKIQQTANKMADASIPYCGDYTPSSSVAYNRSSTTENNTYAPVFNLTVSGTSDDRAMMRKVKKWVGEKLEETFESYERKCASIREV